MFKLNIFQTEGENEATNFHDYNWEFWAANYKYLLTFICGYLLEIVSSKLCVYLPVIFSLSQARFTWES